MNNSVNMDTRPLPPGWSTHFDSQRQAWYYIQHNVSPAKTSYIHPLGPNFLSPASPTVPSNASSNSNTGLSFAQQLYASSFKTPSSQTSPASAHSSPLSSTPTLTPSVANSPPGVGPSAAAEAPPYGVGTAQRSAQPAVPNTPTVPPPVENFSNVAISDNSGNTSSASVGVASPHPQPRPQGARTSSISTYSTSSQGSRGITPLPSPVAHTTSPEHVPTTPHQHDSVLHPEAVQRAQSYQGIPSVHPSAVHGPRRPKHRSSTFPSVMADPSETYSSSFTNVTTMGAFTPSNQQNVSRSPGTGPQPVRTIHTQAKPSPNPPQNAASVPSFSSPQIQASPITYTPLPGQSSTVTGSPFPASQTSFSSSHLSLPTSIASMPGSPVPGYYVPPMGTQSNNNPNNNPNNKTVKANAMLKTTGSAVGSALKSPAGKVATKIAGRVAARVVGQALFGNNTPGSDTITNALGSGVGAITDALTSSNPVDSINDDIANLTTGNGLNLDLSGGGDYLSQMQAAMQQTNPIHANQGHSHSMLQEYQKLQNAAKLQEMQNLVNAQNAQIQQLQSAAQQTQPQQNPQGLFQAAGQQQQFPTQNTFNSLQQQHQHAMQNMYTSLQYGQPSPQTQTPVQNPTIGNVSQPSPAVIYPGFGQSAVPGPGQQSGGTPGVSVFNPQQSVPMTNMASEQPHHTESTTSQLLHGALAVGKVAVRVANMMDNTNDSSSSTNNPAFDFNPYDPSMMQQQAYADNTAVQSF